MLRRNSRPKPRACTPHELKKCGVEVVPVRELLLACLACQTCWSPGIRAGGKLGRGYWKCPRGCNHPD